MTNAKKRKNEKKMQKTLHKRGVFFTKSKKKRKLKYLHFLS
jgi:hypothetical protein